MIENITHAILNNTKPKPNQGAFIMTLSNWGHDVDAHITVKIKDVYGTSLVYPVCEDAQRFAKIAGKKTLSRAVILTIKAMGFDVKVKGETL